MGAIRLRRELGDKGCMYGVPLARKKTAKTIIANDYEVAVAA